jgi:hypothetical protein
MGRPDAKQTIRIQAHTELGASMTYAIPLNSGICDGSHLTFYLPLTYTMRHVPRSKYYWSTGNGDDTLVTLWNPADEPQDLVFTLFWFLAPELTRSHSASNVWHPCRFTLMRKTEGQDNVSITTP